jgi:hypothetical protein
MIYKKKINITITQQNKQGYFQYFVLLKPTSHVVYQFLKLVIYFQILQDHQTVLLYLVMFIDESINE